MDSNEEGKNVYFFFDFHLWHVGLFGSKMRENVKEAADRWDTLIQHYLSPHYGTGHERLSLCSQDLQHCERFEGFKMFERSEGFKGLKGLKGLKGSMCLKGLKGLKG